MPTTPEIFELLALGLTAGVLGGLLGIGGSMVMIPVLTLLLNRSQHLSQAAAMIVNVFVAAPALTRHHRNGNVHWPVAARMLPAGLVMILIGVELSNMMDGDRLKRVFGVFMLYAIYVNVMRLRAQPIPESERPEVRSSWLASSVVGGITGFAAGLLGIGGGIIAVPLLQRISRLPLRRAIACSTAAMCVTASVGALRKNLTLADTPLGETLTAAPTVTESLQIAACLAPTAVIGGLLGASLTQVIPRTWLRLVFIVLLSVAAVRLLM